MNVDLRRLWAVIASFALLSLYALAAPAVLADQPGTDPGSVIVAVDHDVTVAAGDSVDTLVVVHGTALVEGTARSVTIIEGTATLRGAQVDTVVVANGTANLEAGTTVSGDVVQFNSTVTQSGGATVGGTVRDAAAALAGLVLFLGFAALLIWLGTAIVTIVAGLALAAFGARQTRSAEAIISREPVKAFFVGLGAAIILPIVAILLMISIIGLPLGFSVLFFVLPTLAFVGYLVGAIWMGEWLLARTGRQPGERPYLAAFVGLALGGILGWIPLITAIISLFGLGAVTVAGWRMLVGRGGQAQPQAYQPTPLGSPA